RWYANCFWYSRSSEGVRRCIGLVLQAVTIRAGRSRARTVGTPPQRQGDGAPVTIHLNSCNTECRDPFLPDDPCAAFIGIACRLGLDLIRQIFDPWRQSVTATNLR